MNTPRLVTLCYVRSSLCFRVLYWIRELLKRLEVLKCEDSSSIAELLSQKQGYNIVYTVNNIAALF